MDRKPDRLNPDEETIRYALQGIEPPMDRDRFKKKYMQNAGNRFPPTNRWVGILLPRLAQAGACLYFFGVWIYFWMVFSSSAIQSVQGARAPDWRTLYQSALGRAVPLRQGDELVLSDGSRLLCRRDSIVGVAFTFKERLIDLRRGTIEITASHNANLPMIVNSGETKVRVTGTVFVVSTDNPSWDKE